MQPNPPLASELDLIVIEPKSQAAACLEVDTHREVMLRGAEAGRLLPSEIVTVSVDEQWRHSGRECVRGTVGARRFDAAALGLPRLRLVEVFVWDPEDEYWGEEGEPLEDWAVPIVARGPRPAFEMELVLPGADPEDWDGDPITDAVDLREAGDMRGARAALLTLLVADLRCLDAHAHLGNFAFDRRPERAIRHYEAGVRIGEFALGGGFDGLLPWGLLENRPFMRCLHGFGLSCWRLDRADEAAAVFERMLWLNPGDNQGARFLLGAVRSGAAWADIDW